MHIKNKRHHQRKREFSGEANLTELADDGNSSQFIYLKRTLVMVIYLIDNQWSFTRWRPSAVGPHLFLLFYFYFFFLSVFIALFFISQTVFSNCTLSLILFFSKGPEVTIHPHMHRNIHHIFVLMQLLSHLSASFSPLRASAVKLASN